MAMNVSDKQIGNWSSPPYQITLSATGADLRAQATKQQEVYKFKANQIIYGIMGDLSNEALLNKINEVGRERIAVFPYPKENPKELWFFEAEKMAAPQIRQGKEYLKQTSNPQKALPFYTKALENFQTALKLQEKLHGNTSELTEAISQIKKEMLLCKWGQDPQFYLPNKEEVEALTQNVTMYQDEENIFECFETLLSVVEKESFAPHHYFMSATLHEEKGESLLAIEDYLCLSEKNPHALACIEKAYSLLDSAQSSSEGPEADLNKKDSVRIAFEKCLTNFSQKSPQKKDPTCFICFNVSEKDVGKWLEDHLVPDLDKVGVKPIFFFFDLNQM